MYMQEKLINLSLNSDDRAYDDYITSLAIYKNTFIWLADMYCV